MGASVTSRSSAGSGFGDVVAVGSETVAVSTVSGVGVSVASFDVSASSHAGRAEVCLSADMAPGNEFVSSGSSSVRRFCVSGIVAGPCPVRSLLLSSSVLTSVSISVLAIWMRIPSVGASSGETTTSSPSESPLWT